MSRNKPILILLFCVFAAAFSSVFIDFARADMQNSGYVSGGNAALAEEVETPAPTVYCSSGVTVTKGNGFYMYVYAKDFVSIGGLDLFVYYDETAFTLGSVGKGSFAGETTCDVNAEQVGSVCMSMIAPKGISGEGTLLGLLFYAKSDAEEGVHTITVAAGDCYDASLNPVAMTTENCSVNIEKAPEITREVVFYASCDASEAKKNDSFEVTFYTYNSYGFATANFELEYDNSLLKLESAGFGSSLTSAEGAVYSVNSKVSGYVNASYAALADVPTYLQPAFKAKFTVVGDEDARTAVTFKASGLYDSELVAYRGSSCEAGVKLSKIPEVIINPKVFVRSFETADRTFALQIVAEADCRIAAGDFFVNFDGASLECTEVKSATDGCMVVGNPNFRDGQARFSFICEDGIKTETAIAEITFKTSSACGSSFDFTLQGKDLRDSEFKEIIADFIGGTVTAAHKFGEEFTVDKQPSCTEKGSKSKHCLYCGVKSEITEIAPSEHEKSAATEENRVEANCTEDGSFDSVIYCSVCGKELTREKKTLFATGHDLGEWKQTKAPACTEAGEERRDCSRCDYFEVRDIAALGHSSSEWIVDKEATCAEEGGRHKCCSVCGEDFMFETIPTAEHEFGEWETAIKPTTESDGKKIRKCKACGYEEEEIVAKLPGVGCFGSVSSFESIVSAVLLTGASVYVAKRKYRR